MAIESILFLLFSSPPTRMLFSISEQWNPCEFHRLCLHQH